MLGVAGRVHRHQRPGRAHPDGLPVLQHMDPLGRRRIESPVERVEERPVDPRGGVDELGRVGQVTGSLRMNVDGGVGEGAGDISHPAGVIEVDVGDDHTGKVSGAESERRQLGQQDRDRALTASLDQNG